MDGHHALAAGGGTQLRHTAFLHEGDAALAGWAVSTINAALERDEAVMACLRPGPAARVRDGLGAAAAAEVRWLPSDARYCRPGVAMSIVHRFASDAADAGRPSAWSIGTLALGGDHRDRRWIRYERSTNDVLDALALHAVCTYDTATTPGALLAAVRDAHTSTEGICPPAFDGVEASDSVGAPRGDPGLELVDPELGAMRRALSATVGGDISPRQLDDVLLVASELMTNALRHGQPPNTLRVWFDHDEVVVEVTDSGDTPFDRFADLRPLHGGAEGGYGLWLVGQLADWVDIGAAPGGQVVRAGVGPPIA